MHELQKPILPGKGASDYERYLRTDNLLARKSIGWRSGSSEETSWERWELRLKS